MQGQIQFPCNALPEMIVMEKNERFISGDLGMLNGGLLILEIVVLLLGHLHKQSSVGATHIDTDPIHYNISFGDALLYISSVKRVCMVKSFRPGSLSYTQI